jgi:hypothetical protein
MQSVPILGRWQLGRQHRGQRRIVAVQPFRGRGNVGPTNAAVPAAAKRAKIVYLLHRKLLRLSTPTPGLRCRPIGQGGAELFEPVAKHPGGYRQRQPFTPR